LGDFGAFLPQLPAAKAVIDHHLSQDDLGAVRFVDTSAEATGRLVYEAIQALGGPLTPGMAHNLFAALATDTRWFRPSNATAATAWRRGRWSKAPWPKCGHASWRLCTWRSNKEVARSSASFLFLDALERAPFRLFVVVALFHAFEEIAQPSLQRRRQRLGFRAHPIGQHGRPRLTQIQHHKIA